MNKKLDLTLLRGLVHQTYTAYGLELECWLEHEPAENGGDDHPSTPATTTLMHATVNGIDIANVLSAEVIDEIEDAADKERNVSAHDAAFDRAAERAEFRECYA